MTLRNLSGVGVMGAMIAALNLPYDVAAASPTNMDLCLYGRLYRRLQGVRA